MKQILDAPFVTELCDIITHMYRQGWDERNGGNVSCLLDPQQVAEYLDLSQVLRRRPLGFDGTKLAGKLFLVTATGSYFRNVAQQPEVSLGIVRISPDGQQAELLWGFEGDGWATSEFPAHLMTHITRLAIDPNHRVVMHCHPDKLLAMTMVHDLDSKAFTRTLWQMCSECIMVFPEGVNVLPWMLFGTTEIGEATAVQMETARLVVWAQHGIYGAGATLDEAFGLIETAEKAARVYLDIAHLPILQTITDEGLAQIAIQVGVTPRKGFLNL